MLPVRIMSFSVVLGDTCDGLESSEAATVWVLVCLIEAEAKDVHAEQSVGVLVKERGC